MRRFEFLSSGLGGFGLATNRPSRPRCVLALSTMIIPSSVCATHSDILPLPSTRTSGVRVQLRRLRLSYDYVAVSLILTVRVQSARLTVSVIRSTLRFVRAVRHRVVTTPRRQLRVQLSAETTADSPTA